MEEKADLISPSPRSSSSHQCCRISTLYSYCKLQTEALRAFQLEVVAAGLHCPPGFWPVWTMADAACPKAPSAAETPVPRRPSMMDSLDSCMGSPPEKSPSYPFRRGRKPSRVLYPPLGRKRSPRAEADPTKRWLLFFIGVVLLQILMEEPGQENQDHLDNQMLVAPLATLHPEMLFNSSGDEAGLRETIQQPLHKTFGKHLPCKVQHLRQMCGAGPGHHRARGR